MTLLTPPKTWTCRKCDDNGLVAVLDEEVGCYLGTPCDCGKPVDMPPDGARAWFLSRHPLVMARRQITETPFYPEPLPAASVWVDRAIASVVRKLWSGGYETYASCQGDRDALGAVSDERWVLLVCPDPSPEEIDTSFAHGAAQHLGLSRYRVRPWPHPRSEQNADWPARLKLLWDPPRLRAH